MHINKESHLRVPFNDHDSIRYYDSVLLSTKFKAPRWLVTLLRIIQLENTKRLAIFIKGFIKT